MILMNTEAKTIFHPATTFLEAKFSNLQLKNQTHKQTHNTIQFGAKQNNIAPVKYNGHLEKRHHLIWFDREWR